MLGAVRWRKVTSRFHYTEVRRNLPERTHLVEFKISGATGTSETSIFRTYGH